LQLRMGLDLASKIVTSTLTAGSPVRGTDEVQQVFVKATSGSYKLWFDANNDGKRDAAEVTTAITLTGGDDSAAIQNALNALAAIGAGGVTVTKDPPQQPYTGPLARPAGH